MKILVQERLGEHHYKTPEGYLIYTDAILARTGKQTYRRNEIFVDSTDDSEVEIDRPAEEVFSAAAIASFENKPLANEHPDSDITPLNYKELAVGFVRDVHRGTVDGQDVLLGTIVITDKDAIDDVESGRKTDLSCGYDCDISDDNNPCQRNIRGNHVALCEQGRAGIARLVDSKCKDFDDTRKNIRVVKEFIEQNGNKFDKRKDADAILEYIKKRTGIANADYGDVLYIIKEYTRAEITDSVKDTKNELTQEYKGYTIVVKHVGYKDAPTEVTIFDGHTKVKAYFTSEENLNKAMQDVKTRVIPQLGLCSADQNDIKTYLRMISTFTSRDTDINDVLRPLQGKGFKTSVEKIEGWKWKSGETAYKTYYVSVEGLEHQIIITLYADPEKDWKVFEVNAYMNDSIDDAKDKLKLPIGYVESTNSMGFHYITRADHARLMPAEILKIEEALRAAGISAKQVEYDISDRWVGYRTSGRFATHGNIDSMNDSMNDAPFIIPTWFASLYREAKSKVGSDHSKILNYIETYSNMSRHELETFLNKAERNEEAERSSMSDAIFEVGFVDKHDHSTYVDIEAENIEAAKKIVQKKYEVYRIISCRKVKDAMQKYRVLCTIPGDYDDEPGFYMSFDVTANDEDHAIEKAEVYCAKNKAYRFAWNFHIVNSSVKGQKHVVLDSVDDALVEVPQAHLHSFENQLKSAKIAITKRGKTWSGDVHYQVEATMPFKMFIRKLEAISDWSEQQNVPMTFAANADEDYSNEDTFCTAGIDLLKMHVDDSLTDALDTFEIHWIDTYQRSKGYDKSFWSFNDEIKAASLSEALKKLSGICVGRGTGTHYALVVSINRRGSGKTTSYQFSGRLDELMKDVKDSKVKTILNVIKKISK